MKGRLSDLKGLKFNLKGFDLILAAAVKSQQLGLNIGQIRLTGASNTPITL